MAEINGGKFDGKQRDLKNADSKKNQGNSSPLLGRQEDHSARKSAGHAMIGEIKVKKKLPIIADIAAGVLMLALVIGVIIGSYMLFRYYAEDYESITVTYDVVFETYDGTEEYLFMKNKDVFVDTENNTIPFGKIISVETEEIEGFGVGNRVILTVKAEARYRKGEGYSLGERRLAVGSTFELRCAERVIDVTVTELAVGGD